MKSVLQIGCVLVLGVLSTSYSLLCSAAEHPKAAPAAQEATLTSGKPKPASSAPPEPKITLDERAFFVLVNAETTIAHELGHVVIDEFQAPVLGNDEVAADQIGLLLFSSIMGDSHSFSADALQLLKAVADEVRLEWYSKPASEKNTYWTLHPLEPQRFYSFACLLYGRDPDHSENIRVYADIPFSRSFYCQDEYKSADKASHWVVSQYGRSSSVPLKKLEKFSIVYDKPESHIGNEILGWLKRSGMLEKLLLRAESQFAFPHNMVLTVTNCGEPEAMWMPTKKEIVLCYQLMERYHYLANYRHQKLPTILKSQEWGAFCMNDSVAEHFQNSYCKVPPRDTDQGSIEPAKVIFDGESDHENDR